MTIQQTYSELPIRFPIFTLISHLFTLTPISTLVFQEPERVAEELAPLGFLSRTNPSKLSCRTGDTGPPATT